MIRIRCRRPPQTSAGVQIYPTLEDCTVYSVDVDGNERAIEGVTSIRFVAKPGEATCAVLEIVGVELDTYATLAGVTREGA